MTTYTNRELADYYFRMKLARSTGDLQSISRVKRSIETSPIEIGDFYEDRGSFKGLKIPGLGENAKRYLTTIIELGGEAAVKKEKEADKLPPYPITALSPYDRRGGYGSASPGQENAIRRLEG